MPSFTSLFASPTKKFGLSNDRTRKNFTIQCQGAYPRASDRRESRAKSRDGKRRQALAGTISGAILRSANHATLQRPNLINDRTRKNFTEGLDKVVNVVYILLGR